MRRIALLESITFVMLLFVIGGLSWQILDTRSTQRQVTQLAADGQQAHDALCTFKVDLARRIQDGKAYLDSHPEGIAGISPADIRKSIANQQATLDSLSRLVCDG